MASAMLEDDDYSMERIDKLCELPDHLIHHILSFFEPEDETDFLNSSRVNRKFRRLIQTGNDKSGFVVTIDHPSTTTVFNFHSYLQNVFLKSLRLPSNPLKILNISWRKGQVSTMYCKDSIPSGARLHTLETLTLRYVGLDFREFCHMGELISDEFPHINKLILNFEKCAFNDALVLKFSPTNSALKELEITCAECSSTKGQIVIKVNCPSLQRLSLKNLKFDRATCNITVVAHRLRNLDMDRLEFLHPHNGRLQHCFKINAPQVRTLRYNGSPLTRFCCTTREIFPWIEKAVICVQRKGESVWTQEFINTLLNSVQHAKDLFVDKQEF